MAEEGKKRRRLTAAQWEKLFETHAGSGQSVEAFCRSHSVSPASFHRWRRRLSERSGAQPGGTSHSAAASQFVDLGPLGGGSGWELELTLGGGAVLRLRGG